MVNCSSFWFVWELLDLGLVAFADKVKGEGEGEKHQSLNSFSILCFRLVIHSIFVVFLISGCLIRTWDS